MKKNNFIILFVAYFLVSLQISAQEHVRINEHNKKTEINLIHNFNRELRKRGFTQYEIYNYIYGKLTCYDYYKVIFLLDMGILKSTNFNHRIIIDYARLDYKSFSDYFIKDKSSQINLQKLNRKFSISTEKTKVPSDITMTQKFVDSLEDDGIEYDDIWIYLNSELTCNDYYKVIYLLKSKNFNSKNKCHTEILDFILNDFENYKLDMIINNPKEIMILNKLRDEFYFL